MSNWHGHYFGPGNRVDREFRKANRPVDSLDAAAEQHDLGYSALQRKYGKVLPYVLPSDVDKKFLKDIEHEKGLKASAARLFFGAKQRLPGNLTMGYQRTNGAFRKYYSGKKKAIRAPRKPNPKLAAFRTSFISRTDRLPTRRPRAGTFGSLNLQDTRHGPFGYYRPITNHFGLRRNVIKSRGYGFKRRR